MQRKQLDDIVKAQLAPLETIQQEVYELILQLVPKMIQAGTIYKEGGHYRYGSCEVNESNSVKRVINSISSTLTSPKKYKTGLVDISKETLERQHSVISDQIKQLVPTEIESTTKNKLCTDIADVILTSWLVVDSLPNESGWGDVWINR